MCVEKEKKRDREKGLDGLIYRTSIFILLLSRRTTVDPHIGEQRKRSRSSNFFSAIKAFEIINLASNDLV